MSVIKQVTAEQSSELLAGHVQSVDPAEDNKIFDLLYEYETVQLVQGAFSRKVQFAGTHRAALYLEEYGSGSHNFGHLRGNRIAFCLPISDTGANWWGSSLSVGQMPIAHSGRTIHATYNAGQRHIVMILDREWCAEWLETGSLGHAVEINTIFDYNKSPFLQVAPERIRRWTYRLCSLLMQVSLGNDEARKAKFEKELLTAARSLLEPGETESLNNSTSKHVVEAALTLMDVSEPNVLSIALLCANLNISRRTLELAFRTIIGKSPLQFFTDRRLCRAYIALRKSDQESASVTDIALSYGFTELGRFAVRYRKIFGELPSETLRQKSKKFTPAVEI
jgi:AraC family ethanolamine operon transcriptional activator